MASSSDSTLHDVYISHRVEDTGKSFTSPLKSALDKSAIEAIIDDRPEDGEEISERFLDMIPESLISVVILSKNYAGSQRCLDELVKIISWNKKNKRTHHVLPAFIGVEPTHVRRQTEAFGAAFETLINNYQQLKEKENTWRRALVEIADHSGWDSNNTNSEADIVERVVERIEEIINKQLSSNSDGDFVGISRVEKVKSLLCLESTKDVKSVGIWGTGGIGKTAIAQRIFDQISNEFDGACFLRDVRDSLERHGLDYLSKDMLSRLLESRNLKVRMDFSTPAVQRALKKNKFLVIFDDVTSSPQIKSLVKPHNFYGPGSRIILTSRDKQVLKIYQCRTEHVYEVEKLNYREAFQLFALHAFKEQSCTERHIKLSQEALCYADGLPLALIVLGGNLYDKNIKEWESELEKLKVHPDGGIKKILMVSYEGLEETEKSIFLDIACLFGDWGWKRNQVESILNACKFFATSGLSRLQDKALICLETFSDEEMCMRLHERPETHERFVMHGLLRQMGRDIILHEPGGCSRIWRWEDFYNVMTRNTGIEKVEVISVFLRKAAYMDVMPAAFEKMLRLRVLQLVQYCISEVHLPKGLGFLSDKLTYLEWKCYSLASLPDKFMPNNLIELHMESSLIVQLWSEGVEPHVPNLKFMNLSFSERLISLPDFSKYPNLEELRLCYCSSVIELPSTIQHLSKLRYLYLSGCSKLAMLPLLPTNVVELDLSGTAIRQLPSWIGKLKCLENLDVSGCKSLTNLPESLGNNRGIDPQGLGLVSLVRLELSGSNVESLPASIKHLPKVRYLGLVDCKNLKFLPDLPSSLVEIKAMGCTLLRSLGSFFGGDASRLGDFRFNFANCINLDGDSIIRSVADAGPRIDAIAAELAKSKYPCEIDEYDEEYDDGKYDEEYDKDKNYLCIPGCEVPEWFQYRVEGSLVKLKLFGHKLEDIWGSGLAFCCVVSPGVGVVQLKASFNVLLVTDKLGPLQFHTRWIESTRYVPTLYAIKSEHVIIWHADLLQYLRSPLICSEATFEIKAGFYDEKIPSHYCKIRRCGVTPVGGNCETSWAPLVEDGSQGEGGPSRERLKSTKI